MSKDWRGVEYDSILVIVDRLTKKIHYEPVLTTLDANSPRCWLRESLGITAYQTWLSLIEDPYSSQSFGHPFATISTSSVDSVLPFIRKQTNKPNDKTVLWKLTYERTVGLSRTTGCDGLLWQNLHITTLDKQAQWWAPLRHCLATTRVCLSYKDNCDPRLKSGIADGNAAALRDLIKELKVNLTESQELQTLYHNQHFKERTYRPGESV